MTRRLHVVGLAMLAGLLPACAPTPSQKDQISAVAEDAATDAVADSPQVRAMGADIVNLKSGVEDLSAIVRRQNDEIRGLKVEADSLRSVVNDNAEAYNRHLSNASR